MPEKPPRAGVGQRHSLRTLRAVLGVAALGAFAQLATATVLFDNFRGRSGVPGTQVTPNYQNLGSTAKANLIQFAASTTAASSGTANTVDWAYLTTTPAENYDGLCSNLSGHNNSAACLGQWQGKVIYSLIRFPQVGTYQFRVAHDDEAQIDFSSYATAATSANYRNFVYNIPVGSLASYTSGDTSFEPVPGNFVVAQPNTCYAMRIYWNNQGRESPEIAMDPSRDEHAGDRPGEQPSGSVQSGILCRLRNGAGRYRRREVRPGHLRLEFGDSSHVPVQHQGVEQQQHGAGGVERDGLRYPAGECDGCRKPHL